MERLQYANQTDMFKWPSNWLIIVDDISNFPLGLNIFLDSRVYIYQKDDNVVHSLYRLPTQRDYMSQIVCVVKNNELQAFKSVLEFSDRKNLNKNILGVGYVTTYNQSYEEIIGFR